MIACPCPVGLAQASWRSQRQGVTILIACHERNSQGVTIATVIAQPPTWHVFAAHFFPFIALSWDFLGDFGRIP